MTGAPRLLIDGLGLPEGPRWRDGRLVFSDILAREIVAVSPDGARETLAAVPGQPSGLGWLPDGRLIVVSMLDRKLYAVAAGTLTEIADLAAVSTDRCNDMIVSQAGHAYVGDYPVSPGRDALERLANSVESNLMLVDFRRDPGKPRLSVAASRLLVPNGMALTEDGQTLIVAETGGYRLTAFTVAPDGSLSDRRVWAKLAIAPDGICLDTEGCIWVGTPYPPAIFQRVAEGGRVVETIDPDGCGAFACVLGGDDRRTLFLTKSAFPPRPGTREGRIRSIIAPAAGAGLP